MSAISLKSITGITSITTPAGVDNQLTLHTNNTTERVKIDVAGNVHINNHLAVAGVVTATTFVGNLTGETSQVTIGNGANNRIITASGTNTLDCAGNFTFNGNVMELGATGAEGGALYIHGGSINNPGGRDAKVWIEDPTNNDWALHINKPSNNYGIQVAMDNSASHAFFIKGGGGERFRITGSGDIAKSGNIYPRSADTFDIGDNGTSRWKSIYAQNFYASNLVDIGGGTHSRNLTVHAATNSVILIEGASNGTSNLMFGDENDEDVGMLGYNHLSNYLAFTVNTEERLRIDSAGRVGIGTDTMDTSAEVSITNATSSARVYMKSADDADCSIIFGSMNDAATGAIRYDHDDDSLRFYGYNNSVRLRISSDGLLGLNVTPSYSGIFGGTQRGMHIGGTTAPFLRITSSTSSQGDLLLQAGNSGSDVQMGNLTASGDIVFWTKPSGGSLQERLRIRSDSNITQTIDSDGDGFIITAGDMKPMLTGNSNRSAHNNTIFGISGKWNNTEVGRIAFEAGDDTTNKDNGKIRLYTTPSGGSLTPRMTITDDGNLGINQTTPNKAKLHVVADSGSTEKIVAKFRNPQGSADVKAKIGFAAGYSDTANDTEGQAYIGAQREGSGNNAALFFETSDGSTLSEKLRIKSDGSFVLNNLSYKTILPMYKGHFYCDASTFVKFATVSGNGLSAEIELTCHTTLNAVVCTSSFIIKAGHYQDFWVESRELKYSSLTIKCISNNNQNFDIYARRNGGAGTSTQAAVYFVIIPKNDETVSVNNTVYYSGQSITHSTQTGALKITGTGGVNCDINVAGSITGSSKNFSIEHPLTSLASTKKLVHASIEGPQCDLIYRGKIDLVDGTATVNIDIATGMSDGTFVKLNRNVQCFTTNETGWSAIKGSVSGNILTITSQDNSSTDTISWMVVGERQDDTIKSSSVTDDSGKLIVEPLTNEEPDNSSLEQYYPNE